MYIGENIKKIRKEKKLTQQQLAKKMEISRSHLSDIENNRYNPSYKTLEMLSNKLNVSMLYLTTGNKQISDMGINIEQLSADIEAFSIQKESEERNAELKLNLKKDIEEILSSELSYTQTIYLTGLLNFLNHSSEDDVKILAAIITNLNKYKNTGNDNQIDQNELLNFIESETKFYKEFLKRFYNYKEDK